MNTNLFMNFTLIKEYVMAKIIWFIHKYIRKLDNEILAKYDLFTDL